MAGRRSFDQLTTVEFVNSPVNLLVYAPSNLVPVFRAAYSSARGSAAG
jgi:hypothetical protein